MLADPSARGALTATFYAVAYLGFAVPVLMSAGSVGTDYDGALVTVGVAGLLVAGVLALGPGRGLLRTGGGAARP